MKDREFLEKLGWFFIFFGIFLRIIYPFIVIMHLHNSIVSSIKFLIIPLGGGWGSFTWFGIAMVVWQRNRFHNNNDHRIFSKNDNESVNKKENLGRNIFLVVAVILLTFLQCYIHNPLMFKDGTSAIYIGMVILFIALGICVYIIGTFNEFMQREISKNPHRASIIGIAVFLLAFLLVSYILWTFLNNLMLNKLDKSPSPLASMSWFFFDLFLIVLSLMSFIFTIRAFWRREGNRD